MMKRVCSVVCSAAVSLFALNGLMAATDGTWTAGSDSWTNAANWANGVIAGDGGGATFIGPASQNRIAIPDGHPFTLSELIFNPTGVVAPWYFSGETNTLVAPARFEINRDNVFFYGALTGSDGLHFFGKSEHSLTLENTNLFTGTVTIENGRLLPTFDESLGAVPSALIPNAVVVSNATLGNFGVPGLEIHAHRGITVVENAYFHGRDGGSTGYMRIHSPITGDGNVWILRQNSFMEFSGSGSDYTGDTIFGGTKLGYFNNASASALLRLGADEVIPHGQGKGRLLFANFMEGILDLQGHTETVNGIGSPDDGDFRIINSAAEPGLLKVGADNSDSQANGIIGAGVTLEKIGTGALRFADRSPADPQGTLKLSGGALEFTDPAHLGKQALALNGGTLRHADTQPGLAEYVGPGSSSIDLTAPLSFSGIRLSPRMGDRGINDNFANNTQYQYLGQWHVPADGDYSFAQSFDDRVYLAIDGNPVLENDIPSLLIVQQDIHLEAGWHDIEIRVFQGTGSVGPRTNAMDTAIVYDPGNGDFSDFSNARAFKDPGDGSVLRTRSLGTDTVTARARAELLAATTLDRSGTASPLVWVGDLVTMTPSALRLTVSGGPAEPFRFGSTDRHAVFFADIDDANDVIFQNNAWLLAAPTSSAWDIAPGADIAIGATGILSGNRTLSDYSLRIPVAAPLGNGTETVTVGGAGKAVTFDATRIEDGRLTDDPGYAFTAANNVVLSGTDARVAFDGAGTVTYTGEISGNGALVKNGSGTAILAAVNPLFAGDIIVNAGSLIVSADAQLGAPANAITLNGGQLDLPSGGTFARTITSAGGGISVNENAPLTLAGTLNGTFTKTGPGVLTLPGVSPALDLYVSEGDVSLNAATGASVRHILGVDEGASVRIDAANGDQIAGNVTLTGGTFDLAGHAETIGALNSANALSSIINSESAPATLTAGDGNANGIYIGGLSGDLALTKTGTGSLSVTGASGTQTATGPVTVTAGDFALGLGVRQIRFVPTRTRTPDTAPTLSEFQITRNGKVVPWPTGTSTSATSSSANNPSRHIILNDTRAAWQADTAQGQYFTIHMPESVVFDGYRWYTSTPAINSTAGDPVAWEIHVSADNTTFYLADARDVGTAISTLRSTKAGQWALGQYTGDALVPASVSVADGATFRVQLANHAVGVLSGAGTLDLRSGVRLDVADLSAFTGTISGKDATLALGSAMPISLHAAATGVSVVNGASEPLSAILGSRGETAFCGALKDGAEPLGLTKLGTSDMYLIDAGSAYTGDTEIESGSLTVSSGTFTFRYLRFNPTLTKGNNIMNSGFCLAISELQLLMNDQPVAWPPNSTASTPFANHSDGASANAINGRVNDRWLSSVIPNPLTIDTQSGVTFNGYRYYTSGVNGADVDQRPPVIWTLEGSNDGDQWVPIDNRTIDPSAIPAFQQNAGQPVGPFTLGLSAFTRLPAALCAETPPTNRFLSGVTAQYLRFTVTQTSLEDWENGNDRGFQFSEFQILKDDAVILWPEGTTATAPGGQWQGNNDWTPARVVNNTALAGAGDDNDRWLSDSLINPLTITLPAPVTFDAYQYITAHNVFGRNPSGWKLEVSTDGDTWHMVDDRLDETTPSSARAVAGPYPLVLPACGAAVDMIPDASRVIVHAGAALRIGEGTLETVGPLSGAGTVAIRDGAVLGINLTKDAEFAGALDGSGGTLALLGDHAQRFTGSTATPGALTVDFRGGRFGGLLKIGGTLTVTGDVAYLQPDTFPAVIPLFTFGSIEQASCDALVAGTASLDVPKGYVANVSFKNNTATLSITAPGMILILQ